jgi:hypothetical protein
MAVAVIGVELVLAATVWRRRTWFIAAPLGIAFHASIVLTGLEIGLFAYLMVALYSLVIPEQIVAWIGGSAAHEPGRRSSDGAGRAEGGLSRWLETRVPRTRWTALITALVAALGIAMVVDLPHARLVASLGGIAVLVAALVGQLRGRAPALALAIAHVVAISLWLAVDTASDVSSSYYKFWGGSQRRLGHLDIAEQAYRGMIDVAPRDASGHFQLGRLLLPVPLRGEPDPARTEEGLAELHAAQRLDPSHARPWIHEARWLLQQGQRAQALDRAREAVAAEPSSQDARALLESVLGSRPPTRPQNSDDQDSP